MTNGFAWLEKYILPFESDWSIREKFCFLNQIGLASFTKIRRNNPGLPFSSRDVTGSFELHYDKYSIPEFRFCPECMKHGYHSRIHQLRYYDKCFIHDIPLQESKLYGLKNNRDYYYDTNGITVKDIITNTDFRADVELYAKHYTLPGYIPQALHTLRTVAGTETFTANEFAMMRTHFQNGIQSNDKRIVAQYKLAEIEEISRRADEDLLCNALRSLPEISHSSKCAVKEYLQPSEILYCKMKARELVKVHYDSLQSYYDEANYILNGGKYIQGNRRLCLALSIINMVGNEQPEHTISLMDRPRSFNAQDYFNCLRFDFAEQISEMYPTLDDNVHVNSILAYKVIDDILKHLPSYYEQYLQALAGEYEYIRYRRNDVPLPKYFITASEDEVYVITYELDASGSLSNDNDILQAV